MIPWIKPNFFTDTKLITHLKNILLSGNVTNNGPILKAFESEAAEYLQVKDTIAVSNGSNALLLSVKALNCKGKAVLPSFTFLSTLSCVIHNNLDPIFCDVDPKRWTLCPNHLEKLLKKHKDISLIIPVNSFGVAPDLPRIVSLAKRYNTKILYDDAHGFGSQINPETSRRAVDIRIISLHATKILPAIEGGLIICKHQSVQNKISQLRSHGLTTPIMHSIPGFNFKMDELRAAIGRHGLKRIDKIIARRTRYVNHLKNFIKHSCPETFIPQAIPRTITSNYTNFAVQIPNAKTLGLDKIIQRFNDFGIQTRRYFYPPLHQLTYFQKQTKLPITEDLAQTLLCLPLHSTMRQSDLKHITSAMSAISKGLE